MRKLIQLLLFAPALVWADNVYVQDTKGVGVSEAEAAATTELFRSAAGELGHIIVPNQQQAHSVLRPKLIQLGESYVLTLEKVRAGEVVYSSKMTAEEIEELDILTARLTRAVMDENKASDDSKVGEVSQAETHRGTLRKRAKSTWFVAFGPYTHANSDQGKGTLVNFNIAYNWNVNPHAAVRLYWDSLSGGNDESKTLFSAMGIGAQYFITARDIAPFVAAELGYGHTNTELEDGKEKNSNGFVISGGIGYQFFRTSDVNLDLTAKYMHLLPSGDEDSTGFYGLSVGLHF
jgi:hypothetical protein